MATSTEILKRKKRNEHLLTRATLATAMAISAVGGTIWVANEIANTPKPPAITQDFGDLPTPPSIPMESNPDNAKQTINKVPLADITKTESIISMVPFSGKLTAEHPIGYSMYFGNLTIVDIKKDDPNNLIWVGLATPNKELIKEYIGKDVQNYNGDTVPLANYNGFTAWIAFDPGVVSVMSNNTETGIQGLSFLENWLKVGKAISVSSTINQNHFGMDFRDMNLQSLELLNNNLGKPNTDRSDTEFKFKGDFVFIDASQY